MRFLLIILYSLFITSLSAQQANLLLGNSYSSNFYYFIYNDDYHTSVKPIIKSDLKFDIDSIVGLKYQADFSNWYLRKIFSEHFILLKGEDYRIIASPIINFSKGKEFSDKKNTFTNTRGFIVQGDLGEKISFFSSFAENQSIFPNYIDAHIRDNRVVRT